MRLRVDLPQKLLHSYGCWKLKITDLYGAEKNVFRSENDWESIQDKCCMTHTHTKSISIVSSLFHSTRVCILCLIKKHWRAKKREGLMCLFHLCSNAPSDRRSTCAATAWDDDLLGCVSLHRLLASTTNLIILQRKSLNQAYGAIVKLIFIVQLIFSSTFPYLQCNVN